MASSVFFKFRSNKDHTRVTFDGTGITVFDLKREIITLHRLGDGTDLNLHIYNEDTNEEYDDDTTVIPRSTSIIAIRRAPAKHGKGTAHRYVSAKMPTTSIPNAQRAEKSYSNAKPGTKKDDKPAETSALSGTTTSGDTEEERIKAMFQANSEVWNKTQEHMATATPIYRNGPAGGFRKSAVPVPSHPPPQGYICYRCGEKGHWIQACPTNADPNFDGRPRVKRTTGIPRSFLKTVEKPVMPTADQDDPTAQREGPSSIMVNAEGEYVVAEPDKASWESYQQKAAKSSTKPGSAEGNKELQERGLECAVDHKLFKDAVKTPCCGKVYCEDCIQNLLFETDFVCPNCDAKDILLDRLVVDTETREKIEAYEKGLKSGPKEEIKASSANSTPITTTSSPPAPPAGASSKTNTGPNGTRRDATPVVSPPTIPSAPSGPKVQVQQKGQKIGTLDSYTKSASPPNPKKRSFEEDTTETKQVQIPSGPKAMRVNGALNGQNSQYGGAKPSSAMGNQMGIAAQQFPQMPTQMQHQQAYNNYQQSHYQQGFNGNVNGYGGYDNSNGYYSNSGVNNQAMYMGSNPGMMNGGMNMSMGMGMGSEINAGMGGNTMGNMNGMGTGMGYGVMNGRMGPGVGMGMNVGMSQGHLNNMNMNLNMNGMGMMGNGMGTGMGNGMNNMMNGMGGPDSSMMDNSYMVQHYHHDQSRHGYFPNQQKTVFSEPFPSEEESAYIRKPVNPHRHARPKRIRPSDYKALGGGD